MTSRTTITLIGVLGASSEGVWQIEVLRHVVGGFLCVGTNDVNVSGTNGNHLTVKLECGPG